MFEKLEITAMAQALATHAEARLGAISQNIANADTPGYKARDVSDFNAFWQSAQGGGGMRATRIGHMGSTAQTAQPDIMLARSPSSPNGNSVSLESEMVKAVDVRQQHDMALAIYRNTSEILRTALGRR